MPRLEADWLARPETQRVFRVLGDDRAYAVGGCVRDSLLGRPVGDIDVATSLRPDEVATLAKRAGVKIVPTGIEHGTVTLVVDGHAFEVTTFRSDVETDGRRAVVRYSDDLAEDAARRDFTMNALYADADGRLTDPTGGLADLRSRRIRFIGRAGDRVREDYLRILRYFRFLATHGDPGLGPDPDALAAISDNLEGLGKLSRERVGSEMLRLLGAGDPAPAVAVMSAAGVLAAVLPGAETVALAPLVHLEAGLGARPEPIRRLAALGGSAVAERLRLSKAEARRLVRLRDLIASPATLAEIAWRDGGDMAADVAMLRAAVAGTELASDVAQQIAAGEAARFPLAAADLMPGLQGVDLGEALKRLEREWIASGFTLDREALLARL